MQSIDITSLERKLRAHHLLEPALRALNASLWLLYWFVLPVALALVVLPIGLVLAGEGGDRVALLSLSIGILAAGLFYYGSLRSIFSFTKGWAWLGCIGYGALAIAAVVELVTGGAAWFAQDKATFAYFAAFQLLTTLGMLGLFLANLAVLRLTPAERQMLRPAKPLRLFPRRRFRSVTCLPDVIDYVPSRWTRGWIASLYLLGTAFFLVIPYNMLQGSNHFNSSVAKASEACEAAADRDECVARELHDLSVGMLWGLPATILFCLATAGWVLRRAQRRLVFSLEHVVHLDGRRPILFLRPFGDDHVRLPSAHVAPLRWLFRGVAPVTTLEQMVLERFTQLGPVIAIGNPTDVAAPFGAARSYLPTDEWQSRVAKLIGDAQCIVICLDSSEGVLWEFEQIVTSGQQHKCIFIVHPRLRGRDDNASLMRLTLDREWPSTPGPGPVAAAEGAMVIAWCASDSAGIDVFRSSTFSESAFELVLSRFLERASRQPPDDGVASPLDAQARAA